MLSVIYVAAVVDVTYSSRIIEIPDIDDVSMNHRKTFPHRASFEVEASAQGFPVSCYNG